jgi:hypothetical protein
VDVDDVVDNDASIAGVAVDVRLECIPPPVPVFFCTCCVVVVGTATFSTASVSAHLLVVIVNAATCKQSHHLQAARMLQFL